MDSHGEHDQKETMMDYSKWQHINFIPLVILAGFIIGTITIFT